MSVRQSQDARIAALERRLAHVDAKFAELFEFMADATQAAGLGTAGREGSAYQQAVAIQARRRSIHLVRAGCGQ